MKYRSNYRSNTISVQSGNNALTPSYYDASFLVAEHHLRITTAVYL